MTDNELPLFPLDMVLLPARKVPLHIFEDRYQQMIRECLEQKSEFGLLWGTDEQFSDVGCVAKVTKLVTEFPDGRMNIMIEGTSRFRLINRQDIHAYISENSRIYAARMVDKLTKHSEQIAAFPRSGRMVPEFQAEDM